MDSHKALLKEISKAVSDDDLDLFLNLTAQLPANIKTFELGQKYLIKACSHRAICCATILLMAGETDFTPDVNASIPRKFYPLHHAARIADPGTIELLMYYGADPNICAGNNDQDKYPPLLTALRCARGRFGIFKLDSKLSIYQLVTLITLQRCVLVLECAELLAWRTQGSLRDLVFWVCVGRRDFLSLAVLLAVARKLLGAAIEEARIPSSQYLKDLSDGEKENLTTLLDVFEKSGDTIEAYIREKRLKVPQPSLKEVSEKVAHLLGVKPSDTELRSIHKHVICGSSKQPVRDYELLDTPIVTRDIDSGFGHYGTSGRRWRCYTGGKDPKLASNSKEYGKELVGRRIMVWWALDRKFYEGAVSSFDPSEKKHLVLYADGDEEMLNLSNELWNLIEPQLEQTADHPGSAPFSVKQKKKGKTEPGSSSNLHVGKLSRLIQN